MLIDLKGKYGKTIRLGVQTNKGNTFASSVLMAKAWAPKGAKSFSFTSFHTDYHGRPVDEETGYATITVSYFSTIKEGEYEIAQETS